MEQKPSGFVIGADHSLQLQRAHILFAGSLELNQQGRFAAADAQEVVSNRLIRIVPRHQ